MSTINWSFLLFLLLAVPFLALAGDPIYLDQLPEDQKRHLHCPKLWPEDSCWIPAKGVCFTPYEWGPKFPDGATLDIGSLLDSRDNGGIKIFDDSTFCTILTGGNRNRSRECLSLAKVSARQAVIEGLKY